jgi:DNA-binding response OmpR family regulator
VETVRADEMAAKGRILVVEDDRSSRRALVALLRLSGFEAFPAATIEEGFELLQRSPDCLILDLMLPDGNGGRILAHVREQQLPIRVVVTTGAIDWEHMLGASPTPADMVLQKPVNYRQLIEWLQIHCGHSA